MWRDNILLYSKELATENLKDIDLDWLIDINNLLLSSSKYGFIIVDNNTTIASFDMHTFVDDY